MAGDYSERLELAARRAYETFYHRYDVQVAWEDRSEYVRQIWRDVVETAIQSFV